MGLQLFREDVLFYQRFLKANGFYTKKLDGVWGANTDMADKAFVAASRKIASTGGLSDARSEAEICTLAPKAQVLARKFLAIMKQNGKDVRIISGTRTYTEQDVLYKKGRFGNKEPQVTKAKGGESNHNFGLAWDIGIFENGKYITLDSKYRSLSALVLKNLSPELEWGGNWVTIVDNPHYQHKSIFANVTDVRAAFELGKPYL
jgi:peptidoglycan L-alanyl-D-glutamate endopeptidase CwlK